MHNIIKASHIWKTQETIYNKADFLKHINKNKDAFYTFSWYIDNVYGEWNAYLQTAQFNPNGSFATLAPNQSEQSSSLIVEISKRTSDWYLPITKEEATNCDPYMVIWYKWISFFIALPNIQCTDNERMDINTYLYPKLEEYLQPFIKIEKSYHENITAFILTTLEKWKFIKLSTDGSKRKLIKNTISNLFGTLMWKN